MAGAPLEAIRSVPLFAELSEDELAQVARLFKQRSFAPGETVAKEGSGGGAFYLIESGTANVSVAGRERAPLGPGDYFGEIALIDEGARSATITAVEQLSCYGLTYWDFRPLVQSNAGICWKLLQFMVARLRAVEAAG
ncbi:MAG TPA: cyclic nucleotide-binding domain-containing protein [Solirubrobacteraceae bacterium]|jgi:CRP-like cAMP-binding protein|nr:cyclic nucleotide-binding domain-containing protein [Solirubrobacteraceae bacterium]